MILKNALYSNGTLHAILVQGLIYEKRLPCTLVDVKVVLQMFLNNDYNAQITTYVSLGGVLSYSVSQVMKFGTKHCLQNFRKNLLQPINAELLRIFNITCYNIIRFSYQCQGQIVSIVLLTVTKLVKKSNNRAFSSILYSSQV